jgi:hypothetical protein
MQIHEEQRRLEREPPPRFVVGSSETIQISAVAAKLIAEQTLERFGIAQLPDKFFEELAIASDRFLGGAVLEVFREQAGLGDDAVPSRVPDEIPNVTKGGRK